MIMPVPPRSAEPETPPSTGEAALHSLKRSITSNPTVALAAALTVGLVLGWLTKRS